MRISKLERKLCKRCNEKLRASSLYYEFHPWCTPAAISSARATYSAIFYDIYGKRPTWYEREAFAEQYPLHLILEMKATVVLTYKPI